MASAESNEIMVTVTVLDSWIDEAVFCLCVIGTKMYLLEKAID